MIQKRNIYLILFVTVLMLTGCTSKEDPEEISPSKKIESSVGTCTESSNTLSSSEEMSDDSPSLTEENPSDIIPEPEDLTNITDDYFDNEPLNASAKEEMSIYFSNTGCIDTNDALPLQAQIRLVDDTIKFLSASGYTNTFEVSIIEESFKKNDTSTSFTCTLDAYPDVEIKISYINGTGLFDYKIISWENKNESQKSD